MLMEKTEPAAAPLLYAAEEGVNRVVKPLLAQVGVKPDEKTTEVKPRFRMMPKEGRLRW